MSTIVDKVVDGTGEVDPLPIQCNEMLAPPTQSHVDNADELDPRIQIELEKLNSATDEINSLEREIEMRKIAAQHLWDDYSRQVKSLAKKFKKSVQKSLPYYDTLQEYKTSLENCRQYQTAFDLFEEARQTVLLAEQRFLNHQNDCQFDNTWQEMLNEATIRLMEARAEKEDCEKEYLRCVAFKQKLEQLENDKAVKKSVNKSRPYFERKEEFENRLLLEKQIVEALQGRVARAKCTYSQSLKTLELISDEIHAKRTSSQAKTNNATSHDHRLLLPI